MLKFGTGDTAVAPLKTFRPFMALYHKCDVCKDPAPSGYFATYDGLKRHAALVHTRTILTPVQTAD